MFVSFGIIYGFRFLNPTYPSRKSAQKNNNIKTPNSVFSETLWTDRESHESPL